MIPELPYRVYTWPFSNTFS